MNNFNQTEAARIKALLESNEDLWVELASEKCAWTFDADADWDGEGYVDCSTMQRNAVVEGVAVHLVAGPDYHTYGSHKDPAVGELRSVEVV